MLTVTRTTAAMTIAALVCTVVVEGRQRQGSSNKNEPPITFIDTAPAPPTLKELWDRAVLVVLAVVDTVGKPIAHDRTEVMRYHSLRVEEVLKDDGQPRPGNSIRVMQYGGTAIVDGKEVVTDYPAPLLEAGSSVVLFLSKPKFIDAYTSTYQQTGIFVVNNRDKTVKVPPRARRMLNGRDVMATDELLRTLRGFRASRGR